MREPVSIRTVSAVAFVAIENPPVNALCLAVRSALLDAFNSLRDEPSIRGIVLHGVGRCFSAGGDIHEFGTPAGGGWCHLSIDPRGRMQTLTINRNGTRKGLQP